MSLDDELLSILVDEKLPAILPKSAHIIVYGDAGVSANVYAPSNMYVWEVCSVVQGVIVLESPTHDNVAVFKINDSGITKEVELLWLR